ncbi:MAG: transcription termination/antitermination protein NusA [Candidatus Omnitrophica bacterium CG11_big_fil_rev_8_21_14_0_20_64_10]|nr:MAG: transcription termination/antitermination protein NusA [Candidatus Omnitrophica bacterium CG11_big_fil_rev_8_21_14_0_20_64_10]
MNSELMTVLDHLTREKGIDREVVIEAVEAALVSAARKALGSETEEVDVKIDRKTGTIKILAAGKEISKAGFGRIAAQTAKQVIFHKIREAERNAVYVEFSPKAGRLITGTMHRFDRGAIIVELGRTEGILPKREQSPKESFRPGDRIRAYCVEVNKTAKGPQIILSRSHPELVRELFKLEVPEIAQGIVEVKAISREAGDRAKIAVTSKEEKIDCVGACVGMRGTRVKDIVRELHGEKIDIIRWEPALKDFVSAALAPAKVAEIRVSTDKTRAEVIVDDDQLSLAIGKKGQNVRLASKLTGLELDVRSRAQIAILSKASIADLSGVGPKTIELLEAGGIHSVGDIARADLADLMAVKGIGEKTAQKILEEARKMMAVLEQEAFAKAEAAQAAASVEGAAETVEQPAEPPAAEAVPEAAEPAVEKTAGEAVQPEAPAQESEAETQPEAEAEEEPEADEGDEDKEKKES